MEELNNELKKVALTAPVEPDKFDKHMSQARTNDITARCKVFLAQAKLRQERINVATIQPSVY